MSAADQEYVPQDGTSKTGSSNTDNSYASRTGQDEVPVVGDNTEIETGLDDGNADSDERLRKYPSPLTLQPHIVSLIESQLTSPCVVKNKTRPMPSTRIIS